MALEVKREKSRGKGASLRNGRKRLEDATLLALKMENGAMGEGMQMKLEQAREWILP